MKSPVTYTSATFEFTSEHLLVYWKPKILSTFISLHFSDTVFFMKVNQLGDYCIWTLPLETKSEFVSSHPPKNSSCSFFLIDGQKRFFPRKNERRRIKARLDI
jgi:hypothetical protein